jgi:hypothetical protein
MAEKIIPTIPLSEFDFSKKDRELSIYSEVFSGSFPCAILVESHHSGRTVEFKPIGMEHPRFDHDFWDGEMAIYEPVTPVPNVALLVVRHAY